MTRRDPTRNWKWNPHKSITIEIDAHPDQPPRLDIGDTGSLGPDVLHRLDHIIAEFEQARRVLAELLLEHPEEHPDEVPNSCAEDCAHETPEAIVASAAEPVERIVVSGKSGIVHVDVF